MSNPLELFSEITCEEIFSHLAVKDLLNCTLVNKQYNEFIGNSPGCMKKLKISLNYVKTANDEANTLQFLTTSKRKYQHFENYGMSIDWFNANMSNFNFKSIKLKRVMVFDETELEKFFKKICATIEELKLERYINTHVMEFDPIYCSSFPKLRILELHYIPHFMYKTLSTCNNLVELRITGKRDAEFYQLLKQNRQLKRLAIVSSEIDNYFEENLTDFIKFKLSYFEARDIYNLSATCIANFKKLIENQMNTLEEIDLGDWIAVDIVQMIFHMPKLQTLTFKGFHNVEEHINMNEIQFHTSQTITTLNLIDTFSRLDIIQSFVNACPQVERLKLYSLKENALIFLSQALPNLKSLAVDLMEVENLNNQCDFVHLCEFSMKVCHKNLQISDSLDNNFENLVKTEVMNMAERNKVKFVI